ncbi:MAG TPA: hypothetical protein DEP23_14750 [Ruminococcaceae bacterium]|nr:hypothetical protein [Oscillospiraceae bacterium]
MGKKQQEDYAAELQKSYEHWVDLYENGGSDPCCEDGVNLNLVRNHILYYRNKIEETMSPENYSSAYFKERPPEVDQKYMARVDEIRAAAKVSLGRYKVDPNYQYILRHQDDFSPKTKKKLCIDAVIGYATGLEHHIEHDDLVAMRRHEHAESYLKSFEDCVRRMQEMPTEEVQLSLFSFSAGGLAEPDEDDFDEDEVEEFGGMTMI